MSRTARSENVSQQFSKRILVTVFRDMTDKVSKIIWQHEKPLLEVIHGEGNVEEVPNEHMDDGYSSKPAQSMLVYNKKQDHIPKPSESGKLGYIFYGDPDDEYERLSAIYGRDPEDKNLIVEMIYGRQREGKLQSLLSKPSFADLPVAQQKEILQSYGVDIKPGDDLVKLFEQNAIEI